MSDDWDSNLWMSETWYSRWSGFDPSDDWDLNSRMMKTWTVEWARLFFRWLRFDPSDDKYLILRISETSSIGVSQWYSIPRACRSTTRRVAVDRRTPACPWSASEVPASTASTWPPWACSPCRPPSAPSSSAISAAAATARPRNRETATRRGCPSEDSPGTNSHSQHPRCFQPLKPTRRRQRRRRPAAATVLPIRAASWPPSGNSLRGKPAWRHSAEVLLANPGPM